ncbi:hypothetical protein PLICRDRAFT_669243, partial [Plicaturopsis crispa FD-325 SS-3]
GYGHATRVSAFACHLLHLEPRPTIYLISSAPEHVFAGSIDEGALYRYAEIDPVIVQPLAYRVDRQKSVEGLEQFLSEKDAKLEYEKTWLAEVGADCVLSDAAFLGCLAAHAAGIPSVLITNFTFDSVYSYLSTTLRESESHVLDTLQPPEQPHLHIEDLVPDIPVPLSELEPLVAQIHAGYRCAELLLLLPGNIPIPSFSLYPALPSSDWVDPKTNTYYPEILKYQEEPPSSHPLHAPIPFDPPQPVTRSIRPAPLLVRPPGPTIYTPEGRAKLLDSIGVPAHLHDPAYTKILIVSFGGQIFRKPVSRSGSRTPSVDSTSSPTSSSPTSSSPTSSREPSPPPPQLVGPSVSSARITTLSHLWIPGAPPASKPPTAMSPSVDKRNGAPALAREDAYFDQSADEDEPRLLPDGWIAIVCGVSKEQWSVDDDGVDTGLPDGFFVAPRYVYMPDLEAVADVLMGKLGYGTVAECVDSCTPFVYVSRPLFIEEHGLRQLLQREGTGVELSREAYEAGDWATAVEEAWAKGGDAKLKKRKDSSMGVGLDVRNKAGMEMAREMMEWVHNRTGK